MANPLYNSLGKQQPLNDGGLSDFINQVKQAQETFRGNPREEVQRLLNSGAMTQQQFNQYSQIANSIISLMKK